MAVGIRTIATGTNNGSTATVSATTDSTPAVGDIVFAFHSNDFWDISNMPAPVGGPGGWTAVPSATADGGAISAHFKVWWAEVTTPGAMTVSVTETGNHDEEKSLALWVMSGVDTASPVDAASGNAGPSSASQVCLSVTTTTPGSFLICMAESGGGASTTGYTSPGSMTEQYELHQGGLALVAATELLPAAGATGTRTFTSATPIPWAATAVAVRPALGGPVALDAVGSAAAGAVADLAALRGLDAAAPSAGTAMGAAAVSRAVDATAVAADSAGGVLVLALGVAALAPAAASLLGSLTVSRPLAGSAAAAATLTGTFAGGWPPTADAPRIVDYATADVAIVS